MFFFFLSSSTKALSTICFWHWGFAAVLRSSRQTLVFHVPLSSSLHGRKAQQSCLSEFPPQSKAVHANQAQGTTGMEHEGQQTHLWYLQLSCEHFQQQGPGESWGYTQNSPNKLREEALPCPGQLKSWAKLLPCKKQQEQDKCASLSTQTGKSGVYSSPILSKLCSNWLWWKVEIEISVAFPPAYPAIAIPTYS